MWRLLPAHHIPSSPPLQSHWYWWLTTKVIFKERRGRYELDIVFRKSDLGNLPHSSWGRPLTWKNKTKHIWKRICSVDSAIPLILDLFFNLCQNQAKSRQLTRKFLYSDAFPLPVKLALLELQVCPVPQVCFFTQLF